MLISLAEVEPFYQGPNQEGFHKFMRHLKPRQTYTFEGDTKPKSMLIWSLFYDYPHQCWADGFLLSIEVDPFLELQSSGMHKTMQPLMEKYCIGEIRIEYDGQQQTTPLITAKPYTFPRDTSVSVSIRCHCGASLEISVQKDSSFYPSAVPLVNVSMLLKRERTG